MNNSIVSVPYQWSYSSQRGDCLSEAAWDAIDQAVWQLEEAWRHASRPDIEAFVPPPGDPLRQQVLVELIKVDQEHRWKSGVPTKTEDYILDWPELRGRAKVIAELLDAECLTRAMLNVTPTCQELRARFPILCEQIDLSRIKKEAKQDR